MKSPLRRNTAASAEVELKNLAARRETLEARKDNSVATLEAARSARKNALASDPGAELSGLTRAVRDGEDELETLTGVLADLDEEMAAAQARLAEAHDADVRGAAAKTLEDVAVAVDNAAADLDRGLAIVAKAYAALVAAVPETLKVVELDERVVPHERSRWNDKTEGAFELETIRQTALPNDLARAVLAEGLASACPMAFGYVRQGGLYNVALGRAGDLDSHRPSFNFDTLGSLATRRSAAEAAVALVSSRLRVRASCIVEGVIGQSLEDEPVFHRQPAAARIPLVEVYALESFAFQVEAGTASELVSSRWVRNIPADAADAAVAAGLALRTDTSEGAAAFGKERAERAKMPRAGGSYLSREMCRDLGVIRKRADSYAADGKAAAVA